MTASDALATASHYALTAAHAAYAHTTPATACLALALALSAFAYSILRKWTTAALLPTSVVAVAIVALSLGRPLPMTPPPGDYTVVGADIQVDRYIDALLKSGDGEAVLYRLPYSTSQANALQAAKDGGGGVRAKVDGEGGVAYDGDPPVSGDSEKHQEAPAYSVGG